MLYMQSISVASLPLMIIAVAVNPSFRVRNTIPALAEIFQTEIAPSDTKVIHYFRVQHVP